MRSIATTREFRRLDPRRLPAIAVRVPGAVWRYFFAADVEGLRDTSTHTAYFIVCLAFVGLPFLVSPGSGAGERLTLFGVRLPPACASHAIFGVECPGCGMTRSFVSVAHGRFRESFHWHRLGLVLYLFFAYQLAFRLYCLRRLPREPNRFLLRLQCVLAPLLVSLLIFNWLIGFALGGNGS